MNVLIFKTDIQSEKDYEGITSFLNNISGVKRWTVDTEDIDKVLRIEAIEGITEKQVIKLMQPSGYNFEVLED